MPKIPAEPITVLTIEPPDDPRYTNAGFTYVVYEHGFLNNIPYRKFRSLFRSLGAAQNAFPRADVRQTPSILGSILTLDDLKGT